LTVTTTSSTTGPLAGDGSNAAWPFTFPIQSQSQLKVIRRSAAGVETVISSSDYGLALVNEGRSGGTVTYPLGTSRVAVGESVTVRRNPAFTQPTNLRNQGSLAPETVESVADRSVYNDQHLLDASNRSLRVAESEEPLDAMPAAGTRAGRYLSFDASGQPTTSGAPSLTGQLLVVAATGDGSATAYALGVTVDSTAALVVAVDGVVQATATYSVAGSTLTFSEAPPLNAVIDIRVIGASVPALTGSTFTASGTGAVARTIASKLGDVVSVKDFGATGDGIVDDTAEIQAALDALETNGGTVWFPPGKYVITATLLVPSGVVLQGSGIGFWDTVFTSRAKTWTGTTILAKGAATKSYSRYGITSMRYAGGRRIDPDVGATSYYMSTFMNADASGTTRATPRTFSAAIAPKTAHGSSHWGLRDLRVAPWLGSDGMTDYSSTVPTALANDWDVGVLVEDGEYVVLERAQVVGYWRMAAVALLNFGLTDHGQSERNLIRESKLQGYVGLLMRSSDTWKVTATTGSSATIYWSEEHYWPTSGTFEAPGGTIYTYTGLSYSAPGLTFTGVTPDPSSPAITQLRNPKRGSGVAGTEVRDTFIAGLDHTSGGVATALGFLHASRPLEVSGYPQRGLQFYNCKCQTREKVVAFLHAVDDMLWFGGQFEGSTSFLIASPLASSADPTSAPAATSDTEDLRFLSTMLSSVDTRLLTPRHFHDDLRTINPAARLSSHFVIEPLSGQDAIVRLVSGQNFYVNDSSNVGRFRVTETGNVLIQSGGQLSLTGGSGLLNVDASATFALRQSTTTRLQMFSSGNFAPGADNTLNFGVQATRWANVYGTNIRPGAGTATWTSGTGTPEGAVSATVGSLFTRTDGGASTVLYVKEGGGSGNTGWIPK
jgi:hypothetical protein